MQRCDFKDLFKITYKYIFVNVLADKLYFVDGFFVFCYSFGALSS
jgi:hypothetical protein